MELLDCIEIRLICRWKPGKTNPSKRVRERRTRTDLASPYRIRRSFSPAHFRQWSGRRLYVTYSRILHSVGIIFSSPACCEEVAGVLAPLGCSDRRYSTSGRTFDCDVERNDRIRGAVDDQNRRQQDNNHPGESNCGENNVMSVWRRSSQTESRTYGHFTALERHSSSKTLPKTSSKFFGLFSRPTLGGPRDTCSFGPLRGLLAICELLGNFEVDVGRRFDGLRLLPGSTIDQRLMTSAKVIFARPWN